jgi:hypothetical protein
VDRDKRRVGSFHHARLITQTMIQQDRSRSIEIDEPSYLGSPEANDRPRVAVVKDLAQ